MLPAHQGCSRHTDLVHPWLVFTVVLCGSTVLAVTVALTTPVPEAPLVGAVVAVGVATFAWARRQRTVTPVEQRYAGFSESFEVTLPAQRIAVGRGTQVRLFGETRKVWAPGLLGLTHGAGAFLPSRARHEPRAWGGDIDSYEIGTILGSTSFLRLHTADGAVQFALDLPAARLEERVAPLLRTPARAAPSDTHPASSPVDAELSHTQSASSPVDAEPSLAGTNLRVLTDAPRRPQDGDLFALAPPGGYLLFGRVVSTHAQWSSGDEPAEYEAVLIYVYGEWSEYKEIPDPSVLAPDLLLLPPLLVEEEPWDLGLFETLATVPPGPGDLLDPHCFRTPAGTYVDGFGHALPGPVDPVGEFQVHDARTIDDLISDAIGIPRQA